MGHHNGEVIYGVNVVTGNARVVTQIGRVDHVDGGDLAWLADGCLCGATEWTAVTVGPDERQATCAACGMVRVR